MKYVYLLMMTVVTLHAERVLIVGSGGREHALCWKMAQSKQVDAIFVSPGNAGTACCAKTTNIAIAADDIPSLVAFAKEQDIALTLVGPEVPLANGIVDHFQSHGLACFGPTQQAAQIESSKQFAKDFMQRHTIRTAAYRTFHHADEALNYVAQQQAYPIVIKADGLAAGKGVIIAHTKQEAMEAIATMQQFGAAGETIIIEEFLDGVEVSFFALADGKTVVPLTSAQDYKKRFDGDMGPNTGGMGAISPSPLVDAALHERIMQEVVMPTIRGLADEGMPYTGLLYAGLMIRPDGTPYVLEFNCRFGDPETEPVMLRLQSDLFQLCRAVTQQTLDTVAVQCDERLAVGVVLVSDGYPGAYKKGTVINDVGTKDMFDEAVVFHAGTRLQDERVVTNGGRVLCVTAIGDSLQQARNKVYQRAEMITWDGKQCRTDIGM